MATPNLSNPAAAKAKGGRRLDVTLAVLVFAVVLFVVLWLGLRNTIASLVAQLGNVDLVVYWIAIVAIMVAGFVWIGQATTGLWYGALIDSSNTISLSRLQVTFWTVLVLSAYLIIAMPRIFLPLESMKSLNSDDSMLLACLKTIGKPAGYLPTADECGGGPLQITFPPQLVLAMGISLASFAGSRLIQTSKSKQGLDLAGNQTRKAKADDRLVKAKKAYEDKDKAAQLAHLHYVNQQAECSQIQQDLNNATDPSIQDDLKKQLSQANMRLDARKKEFDIAVNEQTQAQNEMAAATNALDSADKEEQKSIGLLYKNQSPRDARWSDLFNGNLITTHGQTEMGKVQMFFFTIVVLLAYAAALAALMHSKPEVLLHPLGVSFPPFSDSLNALLALSHSTYLVKKTLSQS